MPVLRIAALTVVEAVRSRTVAAIVLIGVLVLCLSLLLVLIRADMQHAVIAGEQSRIWLAIQYPIRRSAITSLCLASVRILGSIVALTFSTGLLPADIAGGSMALVVSHGISRRAIYVGRWLGAATVVEGAVLVWMAILFASLSVQSHTPLWPLLAAAPSAALIPLLICTVGIALSVNGRNVGMACTLSIGAVSWLDGVINWLGILYQARWLHRVAVAAALIMPQGTPAHWIQGAIEEISYTEPALSGAPESPQPFRDFGAAHGIAHLDAVYLAIYILFFIWLGATMLQRRDV
jgi:ABC-type transport system involved in multi-copper enzyme maturation permease subunit